MSNVIRAIIIAAVIIVIGALAVIFFNKVLPVIIGEEISLEDQQQNENNFNKLIENIENCYINEDDDCLCEGLPDFPGSFLKNSKIIIKQKNNEEIEINWTFKKKTYKNQILADIKISAIYFDTKEKVTYGIKKTINFETEPPTFEQIGLEKGVFKKYYPILMTGKIYKKDNEIYFIIKYIDYKNPTLRDPDIRICGEKEEK